MRVSNQRLGAGLTAVIAVVALAGCGGGGSAKTNASGGSAGSATAGDKIIIKDFAYAPADLAVKVGQAITVTNEDSAVHTITADDKSFDTGDLAKGKSMTIKISKPGKYTYICTYHQYMKGTITAS
jgi:plastocyanin